MWHAKNERPRRRKVASSSFCLPLVWCLLATGCSAFPLADSIDWQTISEENETATWSARRHNALGIKWINHGKLAKAETHFQKAAELSPRYAAPRNNLGNLCLAREELYLAAWQFERAAELAPYSPEPMVNLGLVYEKAGQLQRAEECYRHANEISPSFPLVVGNLARVLMKSDGDPAEIHQLLEQLMFIDTRPDWLDWADRLLSTRSRNGDMELPQEWTESTTETIPVLEARPPNGAFMEIPSRGAEVIRPRLNEASNSSVEPLFQPVPTLPAPDPRTDRPLKE